MGDKKRTGDFRRASKILEAAWKAEPHPEIAEAYAHVRPGDAAGDRLKRAEKLVALRPTSLEGRLALARAAIDARDFDAARKALESVADKERTERYCLAMAEIEQEAEGDHGRVREWLARAVRAPRDPVWMADGYVFPHWAPVSPVSGRIDAFEWRVPTHDADDGGRPFIELAPSPSPGAPPALAAKPAAPPTKAAPAAVTAAPGPAGAGAAPAPPAAEQAAAVGQPTPIPDDPGVEEPRGAVDRLRLQ